MSRYDAAEDRATTARIASVKLDGKELLGEEFIKACDTDEGWVDIYETEVINGFRCAKMGPWYQVDIRLVMNATEDTLAAIVPGRQKRDILMKRLTGKVEVSFK